jgi:hypothetical protein
MAALAILVGTTIVGFSPARWDTVVLVLPRRHGVHVHVHDVIGTVLVIFGTAALWRLSARR